MPPYAPHDDLAVIARLFEQPSLLGRTVAVSELAAEYERTSGSPIARRTLIRRLDTLIEARLIERSGQGRGVRYRLIPRPGMPLEAPSEGTAQNAGAYPFAIGDEARRVRDYVRQERALRTPVGYDASFLESYRPGETWYLDAPTRAALHRIGQTPEAARPAGTYAREILDRLLIDLSWASSRLEGNTYSRLDTKHLIEYGQVAEGKDAVEAQMILNHKAAIELLVGEAEDVGFNAFTFRNLHALLSENLMGDASDEGRLRERTVEISGTVFRPLAVPQRIAELFGVLLEKASAIPDPFEQAFFVMVHVPYLQPFTDVNKRVSRLGANLPLIKANLIPLSFVDVPERAYVEGTLGVYELNDVALLREVFVWAYERSCAIYAALRQSLGEPDPMRLRYRAAIIEAVGRIVREGEEVERVAQEVGRALVRAEDRARFAAMVAGDVARLHEGNVARYRLRPSEYERWRQGQA